MTADRVGPGRGALVAAALALLGGGCALPLAVWRAPRIADCPGPVVAADALPGGDFLLREQVRITGEGVDLGLALVAERRGGRLVVVGFNAFGAKALTVVQEGQALEAESHLGRALPVAPANVMRDLHAARFAEGADAARVEVRRPGCGYAAVFVRTERQSLPAGD